jgi:hypothetical protein
LQWLSEISGEQDLNRERSERLHQYGERFPQEMPQELIHAIIETSQTAVRNGP